jgi:hypothetical protein
MLDSESRGENLLYCLLTGTACLKDGLAADRVRALASTGAHGRAAHNVERDCNRWLRNLFDCRIEPYAIPLNLEREDSVGTEQVMFPVLPPHEVFSALWHAGDLQRQVSLFGESRSVVREFWAQAVKQPWGRLHPVVQNRSLDELAKVIGVVFHVDGVEVLALLNGGFG